MASALRAEELLGVAWALLAGPGASPGRPLLLRAGGGEVYAWRVAAVSRVGAPVVEHGGGTAAGQQVVAPLVVEIAAEVPTLVHGVLAVTGSAQDPARLAAPIRVFVWGGVALRAASVPGC